jgi:uncharacterized membrane protein YhaH (DUF805 family)
MSFTESVSTCLHQYANFNGRAKRSEFWWFYLFYALIGVVLAIPGTFVMLLGIPTNENQLPGAAFWFGLVLLIGASLVQLAFIVPMLAVGSRRLHDRGQSGWLQLLMLVPCGSIVLIVFWALEGTPGDNAYGELPA